MSQPSIFDLILRYNETKENNPALYEKVSSAINIIIQGIEKYGIEHIAISYNGGKDSDVCAQLWRMAVYKYLEAKAQLGNFVQSIEQTVFIVFHTPDDFPEIDSHLKKVILDIGVEAVHSNKSFKEGLFGIIKRFTTEAIILGVRRTDPQGADLQPHTQSSGDFPPFMRILPILDWNYGDIWQFIKTFSIPYCVLYEQGYVQFYSYEF